MIEARLLQTSDFPPLCETIDDMNIEGPTGFVDVIDDNITGAVTVDALTNTRLVVDPAYFRQGIAKSLLQHPF
jgi:ribosomal protein S18 acetylase RimI-like enzyme